MTDLLTALVERIISKLAKVPKSAVGRANWEAWYGNGLADLEELAAVLAAWEKPTTISFKVCATPGCGNHLNPYCLVCWERIKLVAKDSTRAEEK